jgi:hypothetical protein
MQPFFIIIILIVIAGIAIYSYLSSQQRKKELAAPRHQEFVISDSSRYQSCRRNDCSANLSI